MGKGTCRVATIRGGKRSAKRAKRRAGRSRPVVRVGRPDASLTGLAGLVCVDELAGRLGIVTELDLAVGPVKDRDRGQTAGQLLVGMAAGLLAGQDCLTGLDRVRADVGSALLVQAPVPASTTAGGLARRFTPAALAGIEAGLAKVYQRWLGLVPAAVRGPLVLRNPTIDCDATDIEVYGSNKDRVGWNYAGVKCGRVHLASWAQAELPLAMDLLAGNDDVRPDAPQLLARALAVLPPQVCGFGSDVASSRDHSVRCGATPGGREAGGTRRGLLRVYRLHSKEFRLAGTCVTRKEAALISRRWADC